jgi:hypothetical protein
MEVIWQREAGDLAQTALRLIMDDEGFILCFSAGLVDLPEWTDVEEVFNPNSVRHLKPGQLHNQASLASSARHLHRIML